jgi:hypothetical protein
MNGQREEPAHWAIWFEKDEPAADEKGRRFRLKCSLCLKELSSAVVFPEHGLRICFACVDVVRTRAMVEATENVPSGQSATEPASLPVPSSSRDNTPSTEGER